MNPRQRVVVAWAVAVLGFGISPSAQEATDGCSATLTACMEAAKSGNAAAQNDLGVAYDNGTGVPQDRPEAVRWFRLAAEQGYARAQTNLGVMYRAGRGVGSDTAEAVRWFRLAAEQGFALAQFNLGLMYTSGRGVAQSDGRAYLWLSLAAASSVGIERERVVVARDTVATFLTAAQRTAVQTQAAACQASGLQDCDEPSRATASWEVNAGPSIVLRDFDDAGAGFSFQQGGLVHVTDETRIRFLPERNPNAPFAGIDFILDLPGGLATNNSSVTRNLNGKGGVQDIGKKALAEITEAPRRGYKPSLKPDDIKEGHTYCFLAADGEHYAKLHVIRFDKERRALEFTWQYQPGATNKFE